jgi:acetyl-CoA acetyltransferase
MIAYPFQLFQCCLVTDGGGALILVAAERARNLPQSLPLAANRGPVYLLGTGERVESASGHERPKSSCKVKDRFGSGAVVRSLWHEWPAASES